MKVISLNIEGSKHLDRIIPFLIDEQADIICLQEIFQKDFTKIRSVMGLEGKFFEMMQIYEKVIGDDVEPNGIRGIAILSKKKYPFEIKYYRGKGNIPIYSHSNSVDRGLAICKMEDLTIATTHFTWAGGGGISEEQKEDFPKLLKILKKFDKLLFCGDLNSPRGGEIYSELSKIFSDNIPSTITTTIDSKYHRAGNLQYVVDGMFSKNIDVKVKIIDGLSDHMAIIGEF